MTDFFSLKTWIFYLEDSNNIIYFNNKAVTIGIQKLILKNLSIKLLRHLVILIALNNIFIKSFLILTHNNVLAKLLSRIKFKLIANKFSFQ